MSNDFLSKPPLTFTDYCDEAKNLISLAEALMNRADNQRLSLQYGYGQTSMVGLDIQVSLHTMAGQIAWLAADVLKCIPQRPDPKDKPGTDNASDPSFDS